jgi:acyl carrier protein
MNSDNIDQQVREFLEEELGVPQAEISSSADLREDLGLDSLDLVELITVMEDRVGTRIDQDLLEDVRTVDDVSRVLVSIAAGQQPRAAA